eukprot:7962292-Pyramimonas_sp.AAC.1
MHAELIDLCQPNSWADFLDGAPISQAGDYSKFALDVACSHLADYEMRVLSIVNSLNCQVLLLGKCLPGDPDEKRKNIAADILAVPEREAPILVIKIRYLFWRELAYCRDNAGRLPTTLWLIIRTICAGLKAETQDIEGINSVIKDCRDKGKPRLNPTSSRALMGSGPSGQSLSAHQQSNRKDRKYLSNSGSLRASEPQRSPWAPGSPQRGPQDLRPKSTSPTPQSGGKTV